VADGAWHGTGSGHAAFIDGDVGFEAPTSAVLVGRADATAPALVVPRVPVDPLAPLVFVASEPLPPPAAASLVGRASGDVVALTPLVVEGSSDGVVRAFAKPDVALRAGEIYDVVTAQLVDFAGLAGASTPLHFTTEAAPPLVPEDGFESVTTASLGGAGVLVDGPLTPLTGRTSLILNSGFGGGFGFLPYALGPRLAVRLAVQPGDTVVRFATRVVAATVATSATFYAQLRVGAAGTPVTARANVTADALAKVTLPVDGDVFVGDATTLELALPAGVAGELSFEIDSTSSGCGIPPPSTALIVDDLRVE
jgi:hypothetical protein